MKGKARKVDTLIKLSLSDSEVRYRRLFEAAQDGILILNAETGMIEDVNPYLIKMLGYSREEFIKKKLWEVGAFKDIEASQDAFEALQENEYIRYEDLPLKAKDGRLIQVEFVSNVYQAGSEKVIQCNIRDITEHRRIIIALQENEKKYYDLVNQSPDGVFIVELSGNILTVNKAMCRELNYSEEELLSMSIWDIIPEKYMDQYRQRLTKILEGKSLEEAAEYAVRGKDGKVHYVEVLSAPHYFGKDIIGFQGIARDITARKQAEEALRESEERYRLLVETLPEGVIVHNQGRVIFANPASATIIGAARPDDLIGKPVMEFVHPDSRELVLKRIQQSLREGSPASLAEEKFVRLDGTLIEVEVSAFPFHYAGKQAMLTIFNDITERKRVDEELLKLSLAVDDSGEAIFMTDREGVITFVNPGFTHLYGYTSDEVVGKSTPRILKSGMMKPEEYAAFWQALLNKQVIKCELINKTKDGCLLNIENSANPILNQQEEIIGFLAIQRDITERKEKEEEIQTRNEELSSLYTLSRLLADAEELENVIALVVRHVVENVHTTFACIALLEKDALVRRKIYPVRVLEHDFLVGDNQPINTLPACQRVLEQNEPVILYAGSPEVSSVERTILMLDFAQSVCLVPLQVGDPLQGLNPPLGLLILGEERGEERAPFTLDKVNLARSIGDQAASAIRRMWLGEQARRRLQRLASLREIDSAIAKSFDLRISLHMILKHVSELLEVDAADVLVLNTSLQTLEFSAGIGFRSREIEQTALRSGEGQAGLAFRERRMVQIPDVAASGTVFAQPELLQAEQVAAYFAVPLIIKGQVNGVLEIYQRTPLEPDEEWLDFLNTLAGQAALAIDNDHMFYGLQRSNLELGLAYDATIEGWSHALDLRDNETEGHTQRVTEMTVKLACSFGIIKDELRQVRWGALLHDIGKMGVPDGILLKPGPLTDEEWVVMKRHPVFANEMLSPIQYLKAALDIPYCHHEKWDGTGYPRGLKGEQIPLVARIFAVVDVWDALTSDRPYRKAWTKEKTRQHIQDGSGEHFDPQVVKKFFQEFG